jgi:hypothetical protein
MIMKKMDSNREEIAELAALLKGRLTSYQRFLIGREIVISFYPHADGKNTFVVS